MKHAMFFLLLTVTTLAHAVDPFEGESIRSYHRESNQLSDTYYGTTVDGDEIRGTTTHYTDGWSRDTWTRNGETTSCETLRVGDYETVNCY